MLKARLFMSFAALILLFGVLSAWLGTKTIRDRVVAEAQSRVQRDLSSARLMYRARMREVQTVVGLAAGKQMVVESCAATGQDFGEVTSQLEVIRRSYGLDFLTIVSADGHVVMRTAPPYNVGDSRIHSSLVAGALRGASGTGTLLMSAAELEREAEGLAEQAFLVLEDTPRARPTPKTHESRGMVIVAAVPVRQGPKVLAVLYGGILLNRNVAAVDQIKNLVYGDETANDLPLGTATFFLNDIRISTTVRMANGNRALGTRVSKDVADRVLDNGLPWVGRAFVVKDWYLTAYEPIQDPADQIIGMLYVGILEQPFKELGRVIIWRYVGLTVAVVLVSLVVAFFLAGRLAEPIHRLVLAARQLHGGQYPEPVPEGNASTETGNLIHAFNEMTDSLRERELRLNEANESLKALNHSYMETLGFVTHELNNPVASMMNYAYLLKNKMLGSLTEKQEKAARIIEGNVRRMAEMIRHYLNLSRIERGELQPTLTRVEVAREVINPLLAATEPQLEARRMEVEASIGEDIVLRADLNMVREVFENLLSNAVKYGRDGSIVSLAASLENGLVRFVVRNEGEGFRPDRGHALFDKFSRVDDPSEKHRQKGTGLGLFITRHIIEGHGGRIEARSEWHEWAEFVFTLPRFGETAAHQE